MRLDGRRKRAGGGRRDEEGGGRREEVGGRREEEASGGQSLLEPQSSMGSGTSGTNTS